MNEDVRRFRLIALAALLVCAGVAAAGARRTIVVKMPRLSLPAESNVEVCYAVRLPMTTSFLAGSWQITHSGARGSTLPQHGLMYLYTGDALAGFPTDGVLQSRACLDLGPADRDRRVLFASGSARRVVRKLPTGVALELAPVPDTPGGAPAGIGILVDVNWRNGDTRARTVSTKLVLHRVAKGRANRLARPMSDRSGDAGILVPPFERHSTAERVDARWTPSADACVLGLSTQMHRRGRCVGVEQLDANGAVKPPASGIPNPCEADRRSELFVGADFTDPGALAFTSPLAVRAGEALRYACWVDNGASAGASVRLGCEQVPGVAPGAVGSPAPSCSIVVPASAECPNDAACVYANAVAGPGVDDEVCGITGLVYDAAPGGGCDVSSVP